MSDFDQKIGDLFDELFFTYLPATSFSAAPTSNTRSAVLV